MVGQILYVSTASPELEMDDVVALAQQAAADNQTIGITGMLCFNGRNFLQVIEGDRETLVTLYERIARDPRHNGVVRIVDRDQPERCFPDWSLHYIRVSQNAETRRAELSDHLPPCVDDELGRIILNFGSIR